MDMLVLLVIAVLAVCFFNSSIFYSRKDWEREIKKYDNMELEDNVFDLSLPLVNGNLGNNTLQKGSLSDIKTLNDKIVLADGKVLKKVANVCCEPMRVIGNWVMGKIFNKIDEISKEIKINTKFGMGAIIVWLVLICIVAQWGKNWFNLIKEMSFYNVFDLITLLSMTGLVGFVFYFLIRDIGGIISLKKMEDTKTKVANLIKTNNANELKRYLLSLNLSKDDEKELKAEFKNKQNAREVVISYERIVLKKYDEKVHNVIKEYRNKVIIGNGISGSSMLDFVVNLYCFYQILRNVARIYKIRLGLTSMFRILVAGCLVCYVAAKGTNWLEKLLDDAMIKGFAYLFKFIFQAGTSGLSMQIYGYWLKYALRPVEAHNISMKNESIKKYGQKACNDNEMSGEDLVSDII